ncbi:GNAT family N-acetyltransferase [Microbacterium sp. 22303]|uniref:GNAT family N-acetyltransferase n=1 Tax=Microbacterium sp. 22303 TaxID=3453905 RepID=UPI003F85A6CD
MSPTATALAIRLAAPEEYGIVGRLTEDAYVTSYSELSAAYLQSLRDVAARAALGDIWVALEADVIVGSVWVPRPGAHLSEVARDGELDFRQLAVAPTARGRGVGEALTRHVIALAAERRAERVVMNSGPEMTGAHALYAKLGFRRLYEREQSVEVEPGVFLELLAFGLEIAPTETSNA